jgi:hypothetical protein
MKISAREKGFLIAGTLAVCMFIVIKFGVLPVYDKVMFQRADIALKEATLERYLAQIEKQAELQKDMVRLAGKSRQVEQSLLTGGTVSLAAADIQRICSQIARDCKVDIKSVRVMDAGQKDGFVTIPVQVTFDADLTRTAKFIQSIETNRKLLTIPNLTIRVKNRREGGEIAVTLQIVGFMNKAA